jgi:hypothetical protein
MTTTNESTSGWTNRLIHPPKGEPSRNPPSNRLMTPPIGEPSHQGQDFLKPVALDADDNGMTEIDASMHDVIDHVVDRVPGVLGALVSSADGLVLASRITRQTALDAAAIAAMSAAVLGLSNRLVQLMGDSPASFAHQRSADGQVFVFGISKVAVLTVLADATAHPAQIQSVGREIGLGLERLFRRTASV